VCEIGSKKQTLGNVIQVKPLGSLGLIDEGEADWKVIAIDVEDPLASKLNDLNDVQTYMPGLLEAMVDWFKIYKVPTGKPENRFALNNGKEFFDKNFTLKIIEHDHKSWLGLLKKSFDSTKISVLNTSLKDINTISQNEAISILNQGLSNDEKVKDQDKIAIDKIFYINRKKL
jgi:hypothetical protein